MNTPRLRPAVQEDLPDLVRIYNHYVDTTHITFHTQAFTVAQRRPWFEGFAESGPHRLFVAEVAGAPVGYASSAEFRPRAAYDQSVETTIYLDPAFVGQGIGQQLYRELLDSLRSQEGIHRAFGGIALPNQSSVALHERFGFSLAGTFHEVGSKFGEYWDVSWYEKDVSDRHGD